MDFSQTAYSFLPLFTASCKITPFTYLFLEKILRWSVRVEQTPGWQSSIECVPKVTLRERIKKNWHKLILHLLPPHFRTKYETMASYRKVKKAKNEADMQKLRGIQG